MEISKIMWKIAPHDFIKFHIIFVHEILPISTFFHRAECSGNSVLNPFISFIFSDEF